jgi:hypothetical protein
MPTNWPVFFVSTLLVLSFGVHASVPLLLFSLICVRSFLIFTIMSEDYRPFVTSDGSNTDLIGPLPPKGMSSGAVRLLAAGSVNRVMGGVDPSRSQLGQQQLQQAFNRLQQGDPQQTRPATQAPVQGSASQQVHRQNPKCTSQQR